jgi:hypothetical protein
MEPMTNQTHETDPATVAQSTADVIKRSSAPETTDGIRWHVQLSAVPTREWLEFFKLSRRTVGVAAPQLVVFDRASANFKSDGDNVEQWITALDGWIAAADARYRLSLDEAHRERSLRRDTEAKQRERVQELNARFKHL